MTTQYCESAKEGLCANVRGNVKGRSEVKVPEGGVTLHARGRSTISSRLIGRSSPVLMLPFVVEPYICANGVRRASSDVGSAGSRLRPEEWKPDSTGAQA